MTEPIWLDRRFVLALHERLLAQFSGAAGLRDEGLFDSALARPRQIFSYEDADVPRLAAAYATGIVRNHPFIDGNKRTGFMAAYVFLARNGSKLMASEADATQAMLDLVTGAINEPAFAGWLRANVHPV